MSAAALLASYYVIFHDYSDAHCFLRFLRFLLRRAAAMPALHYAYILL